MVLGPHESFPENPWEEEIFHFIAQKWMKMGHVQWYHGNNVRGPSPEIRPYSGLNWALFLAVRGGLP